MTDGRQVMRQFLLEHAKDSANVQEALDTIEPFFRIIEGGKYLLAEASDGVRQEVSAVLSTILKTGQITVDFLAINGDPVRHGKPRSEYWEQYGRGPVDWNWDLAQQLFFGDFRVPLAQCLGLDPEDDSLLEPFGETAFHEIQTAVWNVIGESLEPMLNSLVGLGSQLSFEEKTIGSGMGRDNICAALWGDAIKPSLIFYLGFIIGNDVDHARQLQPLISLLPKAIPIGKRDKDGDTWLVFVA